MPLTKNDVVRVKCEDYSFEGFGVCKVDDFCYFVKDLLKDEEAEIVITAVKKNYGYGKVLKLISESTERANPICPIYRLCGGCQLQHMSLLLQGKLKQDSVSHLLTSVGKIDTKVNEIMMREDNGAYRNKMMVPVSVDENGKVVTGYYRSNSHQIIPLQKCYLQFGSTNEVLKTTRQLLQDNDLGQYIRHILIKDMKSTDEILVVFVSASNIKKELLPCGQQLMKLCSNVKGVVLNINSEDTNVVLGKKEILICGRDYVVDELMGLKFMISSQSFYQVNYYITPLLYNKAIDLAGLSKEDEVLDLYCGIGTITLLASLACKHVTGIEIVKAAIKDANKNKELNNIMNVDFVCQDSTIAINDFKNEGKHFDCVFVDPPRKGLTKAGIDDLLVLNANKIVYISCNPATLARDLNLLNSEYTIESVQPVDMFPNTTHVETIVLLQKENS